MVVCPQTKSPFAPPHAYVSAFFVERQNRLNQRTPTSSDPTQVTSIAGSILPMKIKEFYSPAFHAVRLFKHG